METNTFSLSRDNDNSGSSLLKMVDCNQVTLRTMNEVFGKPCDDFEDEEDGYSGGSWLFTSPTLGCFTLYFRWGCPRIGGWDDTNVSSFETWLVNQIVPGQSTRKAG